LASPCLNWPKATGQRRAELLCATLESREARIRIIVKLCWLVVAGTSAWALGELVSLSAHGDPVYLCEVGSQCAANNAVRTKCCRDIVNPDELRSALYTCRVVCGR
jgi:hypothetical protein